MASTEEALNVWVEELLKPIMFKHGKLINEWKEGARVELEASSYDAI